MADPRDEAPVTSSALLLDAFERVRDEVHPAVNGLTLDELSFRPDSESNSIAWLVWHLTRILDDHVSALHGTEQVWTAQGWSSRFELPLPDEDTGYGHGPQDVARVVADAELLLGYFEDVHAMTLAYVESLADDELARVVDTRWDPPVTVSVRLVSVVADALQHVGQAAYVRGLAQRR